MAPEQMALDELVISCCIDTPRLGKRQLCQILLKDHGNTPIGCTQTFRILILVRRCLSLENRKEEYAYLYFGYFGLFPLLNAMICSSPAYSRKKIFVLTLYIILSSVCSKELEMNAGSMLHTTWSALLQVSKTLKEQKYAFVKYISDRLLHQHIYIFVVQALIIWLSLFARTCEVIQTSNWTTSSSRLLEKGLPPSCL